MFALVGASGVVVHLAILRGLLHYGFSAAQLAAALGAMTSNYLINNAVTYRDRRKQGLALLTGYFKFVVLCSVPLAANVAVATMVYERGPAWWVAGVAGAVVAAVWNYITTVAGGLVNAKVALGVARHRGVLCWRSALTASGWSPPGPST